MPRLAATLRPILVGLLVVSATACGTGAMPVPPASPSSDPGVPTAGSSAGADEPGSTGGGMPGDPGTGIGNPGVGIGAPVNPIDPGAGQPAIVRPKPGRLDPHPVAPQRLEASVDGRHVLVKVTWYGGVAPCSVLDSVNVERAGTAIALTVVEGADAVGVMCPEIAMLKATIVDLGDLAPGTWRITAPNSDAAALEITIV
jgi:hypothetical protein